MESLCPYMSERFGYLDKVTLEFGQYFLKT